MNVIGASQSTSTLTQVAPSRADSQSTENSPPRQSLIRFLICLTIFAVLVVWLLLFRWTGDGDAIGHYLNLREVPNNPKAALYAWCRPVYVLVTFFPARWGLIPVRIWQAVLTCITAWVTMRLADRLKLRNATLAGPLFILQPFVFALASDTMTEIPMALGIAIAIHLWWSRQWVWSSVLVSFLPMARPEGFFICAVWGLMLLFNRDGGPSANVSEAITPRSSGGSDPGGVLEYESRPSAPRNTMIRRLLTSLLLGTGMIAWMIAGHLLGDNWRLFYDYWSWPAGGYPWYPRASFWNNYVVLWPYYCGIVLIVLFFYGLRHSCNRAMRLPWTMWLIVFVVHSVLFWGGWFASAGLMRIMACVAPVTALVCLYGWNRIAASELIQSFSSIQRRLIATATIALAVAWVMGAYMLVPSNMRTFSLCEVAHYIKDHDLAKDVPGFFCADEIVRGEMELGNLTPGIVKNVWGKKDQLAMLAKLPVGTIGEWDNQRGLEWFQTDIDEVLQQGYEPLHIIERPIYRWRLASGSWPLNRETQRYAIVRKVKAAS